MTRKPRREAGVDTLLAKVVKRTAERGEENCRDRICFEACLAKDRRVFCWKIFVDFKLQALTSSGKSTVPSRVNSVAYANAASIPGSVSAG
jgi:hypothetical protein